MKKIKLSNKTVIICLIVFGFLLFIGLGIIMFPELTYVATKAKTLINNVVENNNENVPDNDTESNSSDDENYVSYNQYEEQIKLKSSRVDLTIKPYGVLTKVSSPFSLFKDGAASQDTYDADLHATTYEAGTISGSIKIEGKEYVVPDSTKYYISVYQMYTSEDTPYESAGWNDSLSPVRYFKVDDKIFVISGSSFIDLAKDGTGLVVGRTTDSDPNDDIDDSYDLQAKSNLESNVVVLNKKDFDFVADNTFPKISDTTYEFTTTKGAKFDIFSFESLVISDFSSYTLVDDYNGLKIYEAKNKKYVLVDREGFAQTLSLVLSIDINNADDATYAWDDGTQSKGNIYYSSYGTCEASSDATYQYVFESVNADNLKKIGTIDNTNIYEKKNLANDTFTKKIYNEDYIDTEYWKTNSLTVDDTKPLSFAQYLTYHPVIYIKDAYGDYVRFTHIDFFMVGGCAKPAIYLYPTQTTDISVKVTPNNGKLTFTYPKYNNGWNVSADINGKLVNKNDNKTYDYLWWDSYTYKLTVPQNGFVVNKKDISSFLDSKLNAMNLNSKEINEFKSYWVKKINNEDSQYLYVTFLFNNDVNQIARLTVNPQPQNIFRVFMLYKPVDSTYETEPLNILKADRNGYTLIEWGGARL